MLSCCPAGGSHVLAVLLVPVVLVVPVVPLAQVM